MCVALLVAALGGCGDASGGGTDGGDASDLAATTTPADGGDATDLATDLATGGVSDGGFDRARVPSTLGAFTTAGSAGCAQTGAPTGARTLTLTVGGAARTALVVVPPGYDPQRAYPVVFVFHGDGGTGSSIRGALNLESAAAGRAIFAYPDGAGQTWNAAVRGTNLDMDLVFAVRASLRAQYCVDLARTFATGHSRGGFFVNQLACRYGAAELAAIAPHSGTIDPDDNNAYVYGPPNPNGGPFMENGDYDFMCPVDGTPPASGTPPLPKLPPPAMVIHGQCDQTGGVEYAQGRRTAQHWGFAARCSTTPSVATASTPGCAPATSCPTAAVDLCSRAPGCQRDVTFCAIPGMGHAIWCDAPARIWAFFAAH